ncbi:MAG TPA: DUF429 domain-containing protein [Chloroflexota bacterium]|nr:DUF429 domain-containing protein [Chloroflexota bacterium]
MPTRPLYAVDFSGAARYAAKLWVACWWPGRPVALRRGTDAPALDYPALVRWIAASEGVWLFDFPFGIAHELAISQGLPADDWPAFVRAFAARYPTAAAFYAATHPLPRGNREPRRGCDHAARAPLAPHNRRLYRQTYHGLRDVLGPLLAASAARVAFLPWDAEVAAARPVWVAESCPAAVLKRAGLPARGYKGPGEAHRAVRAVLLEWLGAWGLPLPPAVCGRALADAEGDALDALLLLPAAARCASPADTARFDPAYRDHAARRARLAAARRLAEADIYT